MSSQILDFSNQNPARFQNGKWRFPAAKTLRESWFLPREIESKIEELARQNAENPLEWETLAVAFYRVGNREKSRFWAAKTPRESPILLGVAQVLDDDETYLQEMARAGFAVSGYFGYFENIVKIGEARLENARVLLRELQRQTTDKRRLQTLRKLETLAQTR